jgi:excisionase family DNA binding protein
MPNADPTDGRPFDRPSVGPARRVEGITPMPEPNDLSRESDAPRSESLGDDAGIENDVLLNAPMSYHQLRWFIGRCDALTRSIKDNIPSDPESDPILDENGKRRRPDLPGFSWETGADKVFLDITFFIDKSLRLSAEFNGCFYSSSASQAFDWIANLIDRLLDRWGWQVIRTNPLPLWEMSVAEHVAAIIESEEDSAKERMRRAALRKLAGHPTIDKPTLDALGAALDLLRETEQKAREEFEWERAWEQREHDRASPRAGAAPQTSPADDARFVTVSQAARTLAVGKGTISKWCNQGKVDTNGLTGNERRIDSASLMRFWNKREKGK